MIDFQPYHFVATHLLCHHLPNGWAASHDVPQAREQISKYFDPENSCGSRGRDAPLVIHLW